MNTVRFYGMDSYTIPLIMEKPTDVLVETRKVDGDMSRTQLVAALDPLVSKLRSMQVRIDSQIPNVKAFRTSLVENENKYLEKCDEQVRDLEYLMLKKLAATVYSPDRPVLLRDRRVVGVRPFNALADYLIGLESRIPN